MSIKQKIIQGGFYLGITNIFSQLLSIIINIILARLLLPKDFGLIALASTYSGFIMLFTNVGFGAAIIQKQKSSQIELSTLYWMNFLLAAISYGIIALTVKIAADFYSEPLLVNIVLLSSGSILIAPFFTTHYKIKERDLEFKLLSRITLLSTLIGAITAVIAAFMDFGVYSLVVQILTSTISRMVLVLYNSHWKPNFVFHFNEVKDMVWYSLKFKAAESVLYLERNSDYMILGKIFSSVVLGYYSFAYNIMYAPVKRISYIFSDVLFPSFSAIKDNPQKIISGYFQSIQLIALVSFPAMTILSFNAEWIIQIIFGSKWDGAIPIVQILCFAGAVQSITQVGGVIFSSIGKPERSLYISIASTFFTIVAIVVGSFQNIMLVAYLLVIAKVLSFMVMLVSIYFNIHFSFIELFKNLSGPILTFIILSVIQILLELLNEPFNNFLKLLLMVSVSIALTFLFNRDIIKNIFSAIRLQGK